MNFVEEAEKFAHIKHEGKFRKDGTTPYIVHIKEVVNKLYDWKYKASFFENENFIFRNRNVIISSAWLHDVLEKTETKKDELLKFGIRTMNQVVKITFDEEKESEEAYFNRNYDNIIKLADHITNTQYFMNNNLVDWISYYKKGMVLVDNFRKYSFCKNDIMQIEQKIS